MSAKDTYHDLVKESPIKQNSNMDRLNRYRQIIKETIIHYAQFQPAHGDIEIQTVFDEENDHYQLWYVGWEGYKRIHGNVLHIDIKNGKIWVQYDGMEDSITADFLKAGVLKEDIVLGFYPDYARAHTDFDMP